MKTLFLIRHGKASLEGSDRERGLTEEGIEHALAEERLYLWLVVLDLENQML